MPGTTMSEPPHAIPPASLRLTPAGASIPASSTNATLSCRHDSRTASCSHAKTPADRPAQHRAALRFTLALASLDVGLCLGRPSAQTADCGSLRQRQHLPPPQSVQVFRTPAAELAGDDNTPLYATRLPPPLEALMDFPICRNLGSCHQSKFIRKKTFRAAHTPPLVGKTPRYSAISPLHTAKSPPFAAMLRCRD